MKGKCKGQLLVAMGQDSMNHFYPLAWAVLDKETSRTWNWFLQLLKASLDLNNGQGVTFISDMQKVNNFYLLLSCLSFSFFIVSDFMKIAGTARCCTNCTSKCQP